MRGPGPLLVAALAAVYFAAFVHYGILLLAAVDEDATTRSFAAEALARLDGPPR